MGSWALHGEDILIGLPLLAQGLLYTGLISLIAFAFGLVAGAVLGWLREEDLWHLGKPATLYIEVIRGTPLILFLLFTHYGILPLFIANPSFIVSSLLCFSLFEAAYLAEVVRGGLRAVTRTEREAAKSLGLTPWQQMMHVVAPLALRRVMPSLVNQFVSLIKDTSLASVVGVIEFTRAGEIIYERTYHDFEILAFQAIVYFAVCFSLSRLGQRFESAQYRRQNLLLESMQA